MRFITGLIICSGLLLCPDTARGALTASSVDVLDGSGNRRETFTNAEAIALRQAVYNSAASTNTLSFVFRIYNPAGGAVFSQTGNAVMNPLPGNSHSQLAGLAIARFYSVPGLYKFRGEATLDGTTVVQEKSFQISSPNINLIYPPNGARGLSDQPLTFRWVASGASSYRITVSEDSGFSRQSHEGTSAGSMYSYPDSPSGTLGPLLPEKPYYWKVEGLDAINARIAESSVYSFTLKAQGASTSRNIAVTTLEMTDAVPDFSSPLNFRAVVSNVGNTPENNINLRLTLSGMPASGSPYAVGQLGATESRIITFSAYMPEGQSEGLAVACVDIFDDHIPDNCKTKLITQRSVQDAAAEGVREARSLSYQEIWDEVIKRLGGDVAAALNDYTFDSIECANCSSGELNELMLALINGSANLTGAAISETFAPASAVAALPAAVREEIEPEDGPEMDMELEPGKELKDEWSGYTTAVKSGNPVFYTIKSRKVWAKVWEMLSGEEAPEADFRKKMIVGIVAGTGNKAESVRVIARREVGDKTVFDYYMTESSSENPAVPYIFRVYDKAEGKIEFRRLDTGK